MPSITPTLAAACQTQWDRKFVEDHPDYQTWIEEQLRLVPKEQNGSLRDYVIHRLAVHGHNVTNPVAPPMAQNNPFPTYTHPSASQYPQASPSAMNPFAPTTVPGSYGSMLAGSTQPQYINPAAMMLQQPQPVASTSTYPSHSALPAQHQPVASTSTARTTALSHFTIPSASSAKAHSPSPAPPSTPVEQWTRAFQGIEPELDSTRMAKYPMRAANHVIKVLEAFDHGASVPLVGRMDVLKVLGNATRAPPKDFCEAWVREEAGRQILEVWGSDAVKRATKAKAGVIDTTAKALVMPLLRAIDNMPFSIDHLRASKLGKVIMAIGKDDGAFAPAARALAEKIQQKWRNLVKAQAQKDKEKAAAPTDTKKRAEPSGAVLDEEARKKRKTAPLADAKPAATTYGESKPSSLGFLGTSASGAASLKGLSSIKKKAVAPVVKEASPQPAAAAASAPSAFLNSLAAMSKKDQAGLLTDASKRKGAKKKKSVRWRNDDELVAIRLIERAVYAEDDEDHMHVEARTMDINEGKAFKQHDDEMDEQIDWSEPSAVYIAPPEEPALAYPDPESLTVFPRSEVDTQTERESRTLSVTFEEGMPPSATEPPEEDIEYEPTREMIMHPKLHLLPEISHALQVMADNDRRTPSGIETDHLANGARVQDILGRIMATTTSVATPAAPAPAGIDFSALASLLPSQAQHPPPSSSSSSLDPLSLLSGLNPQAFAGLSGPPQAGNTLAAPPTVSGPSVANGMRQWGAATAVPSFATPSANDIAAQLAALIPAQQSSLAGPQRTRSTGWGTQVNMPVAGAAPPAQGGGPAPRPRRNAGPGKRNTPCKFYPLGTCHQGSDCTFQH